MIDHAKRINTKKARRKLIINLLIVAALVIGVASMHAAASTVICKARQVQP